MFYKNIMINQNKANVFKVMWFCIKYFFDIYMLKNGGWRGIREEG
jgi:hypothetical protein